MQVNVDRNVDIFGAPVNLSETKLRILYDVLHTALTIASRLDLTVNIDQIVSTISSRGYIAVIPQTELRTVIETSFGFHAENPILYIGHVNDEVQPTLMINDFSTVYQSVIENPDIIRSIDMFDEAVKN